MEASIFRVMIVDDHPLMRLGLRQLLSANPRFVVVAEASGGEEALLHARQFRPDLVLLDLRMKAMSGLETAIALNDMEAPARIVVLTVSEQRSDFSAMLNAGVKGYLLKDSEPEELLTHITQVAEGGTVFSAPLQALRDVQSWKADPITLLTEREQDIMKEVASGLSNKQVAENLMISEQTVKVHIRNVLRKLNVRSRVAATVLWLGAQGA